MSGKYALPSRGRKERSGPRRRAGKARRYLGQRRVLGGAPGARIHRGPRPCTAGLCRARHAGRTRRAQQGAGSADQTRDRHRRRRQGLHQDRAFGKPRRQGRCAGDRRRHGQYLPARAGRPHRQVAGGERSGSDRAADYREGGGGELRHHSPCRRRGRVSLRGQCAVPCLWPRCDPPGRHDPGRRSAVDPAHSCRDRRCRDAGLERPARRFRAAAIRPRHGAGGEARGSAEQSGEAGLGRRRRRHGGGAEPGRRGRRFHLCFDRGRRVS